MPENGTTDIKVQIAGLKKDIENVNTLNGRLDLAIEKLTDVSTSIKQMLAVHEEKISRQEQIDEIIFEKLKERAGEIYALVVSKNFHNTDTSSKLMHLLLDKASSMNLSSIFALSKYGGRFFFRFDFQEVELSSLPESRQKSYDYERSSKIYSRNL